MECSFRTFSQWQIYSIYSSLFCFAETNINDSPAKHIDEILDDWKDIHKNTEHGLAVCYSVSKVNIIEVVEISDVLEVLPIVLEIEREIILLVIVYRMPGSLGSFIDNLISLINELPTQHRMLIVGDFNLDQMLPEHVAKVNPLIQNFNVSQRSQYSTHFYMEDYWIWYLILQIPMLFLFCRHSSVITLFFFSKPDALFYTEFNCKQFSFQSPLHNS